MNNTKRTRPNPIITSVYTADPAPMVYGDTLYLYTSHDENTLINDFYTMFDWHCFSTKNMVDWERNGYHVVGCATSGKKALELFDRTHPQIVISDIRMPGTDGLVWS